MLKMGKDKHICTTQTQSLKAAKALHGKPYPRSHKFVESLPDGSTRSSIKIHHLHGFKKHARDHMADHRVIPPLYAEQDRVERVTAECMSNGQKRYIVQWADTYMLRQHIPLHAETGYKPVEITRCPEFGRRFGPAATKRLAKVRWQEKEEPAGNISIPIELIEDFQARREASGHIRLGKDACTRKNEHKSNLQRQGYWTPLQDQATPAFLHQPWLKSSIHINSTESSTITMTLQRQGNT